MFRACVWMQGWSAQGTKWGINRCCSGFLKDPQRAFDEFHKRPLFGGSVHVDARSRAMPRCVCADYCKHSSNFALRSFCGTSSETLSHKTPAAIRSNAAARGQAFRLITCLRMLRTRKLLNIPPESLRHELGEALQRIQLLIRLNLHASSGYLCPSSRRTSATSS